MREGDNLDTVLCECGHPLVDHKAIGTSKGVIRTCNDCSTCEKITAV